MADGFQGRAFLWLIIQLILVVISECCIKKDSVQAEEMVARSKYILFGKVVKKITPDPRTPAVKTSYGVEFNIHCIYKGDPMKDEKLKNKEIIIIAGAGVVQDDCYSMEVDENEDYVVFLGDDGNHIVPTYGVPPDVQDLYELTLVCDLIPKGPAGGELKGDCPASEQNDCIRYKFPENKTTTVKVDKPIPLPASTPEPEPEPTVKGDTNKEPVVGGDTQGQEPGGSDSSNTASIPSLTSLCSLFVCILSAKFLS